MNIEEVLQIKEQMLGDYSVQAVDGQSLHDALEIKARFRDWMPAKLVEAGAIVDRDYLKEMRENNRGPNSLVYTLTLSLAKDIAMLSRGAAAQAVRDYFKACEKTIQTNTQQLIANTTQQSAIEDFTIINNLFTQQLVNNGYSQGEIRKNTLLTGIEYEKKTGIPVLAPMLKLENSQGNNSTELSAYEGTHAALSEVAGTSIIVSDIASRYKYVTSKMVNAELEALGYQQKYAQNHKKYYWIRTERSLLVAEEGPLFSGKYKGLPVIKGWRFDPVKFPNFYNILNSRLLELDDKLKMLHEKKEA